MFFVTVSHASERIPPELRDRINPDANLRAMAEPGIDAMCSWSGVPLVAASMHLCVVNLNRSRDDINPRTGDIYPESLSQLVLSDYHGTSIYRDGREPTDEEREAFLRDYYDPFFARVDELAASGAYRFFADVHAMNGASTSYESKTHALHARPDICLGNNGNILGDAHADGAPLTLAPEAIRHLNASLSAAGYVCGMNDPFRGGYIIQHLGARIPCIQIEIQKKLFMTADDGEVIPERLEHVGHDLFRALSELDRLLETID